MHRILHVHSRRWWLVTLVCCCLSGCQTAGPLPPPAAALPDETPPAQSAAEEPLRRTLSGLRYRILDPGSGPKPTDGDQLLLHYRGWLKDGREFDNTFETGKPQWYGMEDMIAGWAEGLRLIGKGGRIELIVPSELGFGEHGSLPDIPPNATLHYVVELVDIQRGGSDLVGDRPAGSS